MPGAGASGSGHAASPGAQGKAASPGQQGAGGDGLKAAPQGAGAPGARRGLQLGLKSGGTLAAGPGRPRPSYRPPSVSPTSASPGAASPGGAAGSQAASPSCATSPGGAGAGAVVEGGRPDGGVTRAQPGAGRVPGSQGGQDGAGLGSGAHAGSPGSVTGVAGRGGATAGSPPVVVNGLEVGGRGDGPGEAAVGGAAAAAAAAREKGAGGTREGGVKEPEDVAEAGGTKHNEAGPGEGAGDGGAPEVAQLELGACGDKQAMEVVRDPAGQSNGLVGIRRGAAAEELLAGAAGGEGAPPGVVHGDQQATHPGDQDGHGADGAGAGPDDKAAQKEQEGQRGSAVAMEVEAGAEEEQQEQEQQPGLPGDVHTAGDKEGLPVGEPAAAAAGAGVAAAATSEAEPMEEGTGAVEVGEAPFARTNASVSAFADAAEQQHLDMPKSPEGRQQQQQQQQQEGGKGAEAQQGKCAGARSGPGDVGSLQVVTHHGQGEGQPDAKAEARAVAGGMAPAGPLAEVGEVPTLARPAPALPEAASQEDGEAAPEGGGGATTAATEPVPVDGGVLAPPPEHQQLQQQQQEQGEQQQQHNRTHVDGAEQVGVSALPKPCRSPQPAGTPLDPAAARAMPPPAALPLGSAARGRSAPLEGAGDREREKERDPLTTPRAGSLHHGLSLTLGRNPSLSGLQVRLLLLLVLGAGGAAWVVSVCNRELAGCTVDRKPHATAAPLALRPYRCWASHCNRLHRCVFLSPVTSEPWSGFHHWLRPSLCLL